jgi:GTP-binding protein LepA
MVFSGIYPVNTADYEKLKASLDKLILNDSSFHYQAESSAALGLGFRCGFLGLLHMEIIQERLRREYDMDIITTYPGCLYQVHLTDGRMIEVDNPVHLPDITQIDHIEEPKVNAFIICPNEFIGDIMQLVMDRRGELEKTDTLDSRRVMLTCNIPLNEILIDFHDRLKSISRGYASMDYEHIGYFEDELVKLDILVHGESVDAFSCIVHRDKAVERGRQMCKSLKDVIPSQMFAVPIQAAIQKNIIARETIRALRKDVTAKCYGGDITRKRKLLERQKEGKKRMKQVGRVSIPQEAFISVLKSSS